MSLYAIYVAGPMTGIPQFNIPAFDRMSEALRRSGYRVVSPVELDGPEYREWAMLSEDGVSMEGNPFGWSWGHVLARDIELIADGDEVGPIDGIVVLPGWHNSKGARLETFVAFLSGKPTFTWDAAYEELRRVPMLKLAMAWVSVGLSFHRSHPSEEAA